MEGSSAATTSRCTGTRCGRRPQGTDTVSGTLGSLMALDFGRSDAERENIARDPDPHAHQPAVGGAAVPACRCLSVAFALLHCVLQEFAIDFWGVVTCVLMLSISRAVLHHRRPVPVLGACFTWCRSRSFESAGTRCAFSSCR